MCSSAQAVCCRRNAGFEESFFVLLEKRLEAMTAVANRRMRPLCLPLSAAALAAARPPPIRGDCDESAAELLPWFEAPLAWLLHALRLELSSPKTKRFCDTVCGCVDAIAGPPAPAEPARPTHDGGGGLLDELLDGEEVALATCAGAVG